MFRRCAPPSLAGSPSAGQFALSASMFCGFVSMPITVLLLELSQHASRECICPTSCYSLHHSKEDHPVPGTQESALGGVSESFFPSPSTGRTLGAEPNSSRIQP